MTFRRDIAGLRAWAVAMVVLYHFQVVGLGGGFIGVDIFFVISGYLMAGILQRNMDAQDRNKLWLAGFILDRAQRIWPALFMMIAFWIAWGWFYFVPQEYDGVATEGVKSLLFQANNFYAKDKGYFAESSDIRLFLHNWSLSVEWMFYLGLGLMAYLVSFTRLSRLFYIPLVVILTVFSFIWMFFLRQSQPTQAFFFLSSRAWEMGAGVLLYYLALSWPLRKRLGTAAEVGGFGLIFLSLLTISLGINLVGPWPNTLTLLPVLGTCLILYAQNNNSLLTKPSLFQFLGKISYSLYLWHWPISVVLQREGLLDDPLWKFIGIALSAIAAIISLMLIENPLRRSLSAKPMRWKFTLLIIPLIGLALILDLIRNQDGIPSRVPQDIRERIENAQRRSQLDLDCFAMDGYVMRCQIGQGETPDLLVVGDSHAGAMLGALENSDYAKDRRIDIWFHGACQPIFDTYGPYGPTDCAQFLTKIEAEIDALPASAPMLIIGRFAYRIEGENAQLSRDLVPQIWLGERPDGFTDAFRSQMAEGLASGICRIGKQRKILILEPNPELALDPLLQLERLAFNDSAKMPFVTKEQLHARRWFTDLALQKAHTTCGAQLIETQDLLCEETRCTAVKDGDFLYRDDDHLSLFGANLLMPRIEAALMAQ